jgi:predicted DNA-binding transcriptional regulator AlpA
MMPEHDHGSRAGNTRRNRLSPQQLKHLNYNGKTEQDIIAKRPIDARGHTENLLALSRYAQGRDSTRLSGYGESPPHTSEHPKAPRKLLDINDLEEIYGFKRWTIRTYCSQGKIPFFKIGRRVFFDPVAIDAWLQGHARPVKEVNIS